MKTSTLRRAAAVALKISLGYADSAASVDSWYYAEISARHAALALKFLAAAAKRERAAR